MKRKRKRKEKKRKNNEERRQKQVPFQSRTHRTFLLIVCVETPHSDLQILSVEKFFAITVLLTLDQFLKYSSFCVYVVKLF